MHNGFKSNFEIFCILIFFKLYRDIIKMKTHLQYVFYFGPICWSWQSQVFHRSASLALVWLTVLRSEWGVNTLRPRQDGRHFADDIFKCIFVNENLWIPIKISLKFVPKGPINNIPALVQIMAWRRPGDKPLSEPMMVRLPMHICVTRPQWVKHSHWKVLECIPEHLNDEKQA